MSNLLSRLRRRRARLASELDEVDRAIAAVEVTPLAECKQSGSINTMAPTQSARLNHSRGSRAKTGNVNPLAIAADKAGHTVRSLAETIGCSAALLSQARAGVRAISLDLANKIETLTGFEASKANWPKLRIEA